MTTYKPPAAPPATPGNACISTRFPTWEQASVINAWHSAACLTVVAAVAIAARTIEAVDAETASKVRGYMFVIWTRGSLVIWTANTLGILVKWGEWALRRRG